MQKVLLLSPPAAFTLTYHFSDAPQPGWEQARQWCQRHFTDMVSFQTREENDHLNQIAPGPRLYWIGIRRVNGVFTWVGTGENVTTEAENWAPGEPNNTDGDEDCVEVNIKDTRQGYSGKWNDAPCSATRKVICYKGTTYRVLNCQLQSHTDLFRCFHTFSWWTSKLYSIWL